MNRISLGRKQSKILKSIKDCSTGEPQPSIQGILRCLRDYSQEDVDAFEDRREDRRDATTWTVCLGALYHAGLSMWEQHPDNFDAYTRFYNPLRQDIAEAERRIQHFRSLGLTTMAEEIEASLHELGKAATEDQYFGFKKISLSTASIILGKMHGYRFFEGGPNAATGWGNMVQARDSRYAYAPLDVFEDYEFYAFDNWPFDARFEYWPRVYTHLELEPQTPSRIKELIEFLEAYPEANHKPLFDHYRVLVPGLNYPYRIFGQTMKLRTVRGEVVEFTGEPSQAHEFFDRELIEHKHIVPILLGARDQEHYFISYFM